MANPHRATIVLALGEPPVEHDVCLNLNALAEIEAELKCNVLDMLEVDVRVVGREIVPVPKRLGVREAVVVLHAGLKAAGKPVARPAVVEMLDKMRALKVVMSAYAAIQAAFVDPDPNPPQEGASPSEKSPGDSSSGT